MTRKIQALLISWIFCLTTIHSSWGQAPEAGQEPGKKEYGFPDVDHIKKDKNGNDVMDFYPGDGGPPKSVYVHSPTEHNGGSDGQDNNDSGGSEVTSNDSKSDHNYDNIITNETVITHESMDSGSSDSNDGGGSNNSFSQSDNNSNDNYDHINNNPGPHYHSRSDGRESSGSKNSQKSPSRSRTYSELIQKGRTARNVILSKAQQSEAEQSILAQKLTDEIDGTSIEQYSQIYQYDQTLINEEDAKKVSSALYDYAHFNSNFGLIPFLSVIIADEKTYQEYRKTAAENDLRKIFPNVREANLSSLIKGRNMVRNWKIAQNMIGEALFNDLFIDANQAISELQSDLNATYVGPLESTLIQAIQNMEQGAQYRLSNYIEENLANIEKDYFSNSSKQYFVQEAVKSFNEALNIIQTTGDYIDAADKVLNARHIIFSASGQTDESESPLDFASGIGMAGLVSARIVSKGLVKFGFEKTLKNIVTKQDRHIVNGLIHQYRGLKPGLTIEHGDNISPGLLHYINISPTEKRKISETFFGGKYTAKILKPGEELKRYYILRGENSTKPLGSYLTRTTYVTKRNSHKFLALPKEPTHQISVTPTFHHLVFEGKTATDFGMSGGGNQVFMFVDEKDFEKYQKWLGEPFELK